MKKVISGFTKEYMEKLENIEVAIRRRMGAAGAAGMWKSRAKGGSMEFSDFREYTAGDDMRRVDWNSFARFDKLFLKLFLEEKKASVNVFLDNSASMAAEEGKCYYSKMLAVSFLYLAMKHTDKGNLFAVSEGIVQKKQNLTAKNRLYELAAFADALHYGGESRLCASIGQADKKMLGTGVSVIISDFFSDDGYQKAVKHLQRMAQNVILIQVLSVQEEDPSLQGTQGFVRLVDAETKETMDIELTPAKLREYKQARSAYEKEMREYCLRTGNKFVCVSTNVPFSKCLLMAYL